MTLALHSVSVTGGGGITFTTVLAPSAAVARTVAIESVRTRKGFATSVQLFATVESVAA